MKPKPIVTKEWLTHRLKFKSCPYCKGGVYKSLCDYCQQFGEVPSDDFGTVVGRALLAIYSNQTNAEQSNTATIQRNGVGFSKPDARVGPIGARMFKSKGVLAQWVLNIWLKPAKDGNPRICKYADQLNTIAESRKNLVAYGEFS